MCLAPPFRFTVASITSEVLDFFVGVIGIMSNVVKVVLGSLKDEVVEIVVTTCVVLAEVVCSDWDV